MKRILVYAGLGDLRPDVRFYRGGVAVSNVDLTREVPRAQHPGAAAWFTGISDGFVQISIELTRIDDVEALVGTLCHEVAHAWREWHGIHASERDEEERLTDITALFLGFGVLVTNIAFRYRTQQLTVRGWQYGHDRYGYLELETFAYALAVQCIARRLPAVECRKIAKLLETAQRATFEASLKKLGKIDGEVRGLLGLDGGAPVRRLRPPKPAVPDRDGYDDWPEDEEPDFSAEPMVFRVRGGSLAAKKIGNLIIGGLIGFLVGMLAFARLGLIELAILPSVLGGFWLQRNTPWRDADRCSDPACNAALPPTALTCPGCGGELRGTLDHRDERLAAEEALH